MKLRKQPPPPPEPTPAERVASLEGFIHSMVRKHLFRLTPGGALDYEDLVQIGRMGALHATKKFDPARGLKFISYAGDWVESYIRREIETHGRTIRISWRVQHAQIKEDADSFEAVNHRARCAKNNGVVSMDAVLHARLDNISLHNIIVDDKPTAEDKLSAFTEQQKTHDLFRFLTERERFVIKARFWEERNLRSIGEELGFSRERVRQIEARALNKLRVQAGVMTPLMAQHLGVLARHGRAAAARLEQKRKMAKCGRQATVEKDEWGYAVGE